jgi:uncharacterized protein YgiM (DUF1202 family)
MIGEKLTESKLTQLVTKYGQNTVQPTKARKYLGKVCYDCAGLVAKAFNTVGIRLATGASSAWRNTRWASSGTISSMPKDKVCVLYKQGSSGMSHTGIYIKGNQVVHAKGIDYGVVKEAFSTSWTHYGIPQNFYSDDIPSTPSTPVNPPSPGSYPFNAKVVVSKGSTVNFRKSPSTGAALIQKINQGEVVSVTGEASADWYTVTYNGKNGFIMKEFLVKV